MLTSDDLITTSDTGYGINEALKGYKTTLAVVRCNLTFQILLNKAPALIGFGCPVRKPATRQINAAITGNLRRVLVAGFIFNVQLYQTSKNTGCTCPVVLNHSPLSILDFPGRNRRAQKHPSLKMVLVLGCFSGPSAGPQKCLKSERLHSEHSGCLLLRVCL